MKLAVELYHVQRVDSREAKSYPVLGQSVHHVLKSQGQEMGMASGEAATEKAEPATAVATRCCSEDGHQSLVERRT